MTFKDPKIIEDIKPILKKYGFKDNKKFIKDFEFKSMEEWAEIEKNWKAKHPILYILREFYYKLYRLWNHKIAMIPKEIKWFYQRGKRGYSDCDVWSFDGYLAEVISGGCKQLSENTHSYPCDSSPEEWNKHLNLIVKEFEEYNKILDLDKEFDKLSKEEFDEKLDRMFGLLRKHFGNLWD